MAHLFFHRADNPPPGRMNALAGKRRPSARTGARHEKIPESKSGEEYAETKYVSNAK
jgi:hypothetical protein